MGLTPSCTILVRELLFIGTNGIKIELIYIGIVMGLTVKTKNSDLLQDVVANQLSLRALQVVICSMSILLTPVLSANVIGSDTQNFNPTVSSPDFTTVHSTNTLPSGRFNFSLFLNQATNSLPYEDESTQSRTELNDSLASMDVGIGYGITKNLDLGIILPFVMNQSIDEDAPRGEFKKNGNTEVKALIKYRAYEKNQSGVAVIASGNLNRIEDNPHSGIDGGPTFNLELAMDTKIKKFHVAANIGYRFHSPGEKVPGSIVDPIGNQILGSVAGSMQITNKGYIVSEIYTAQASDFKIDSDRSESAAEIIGGYKHHATDLTTLHAGVGTEINHGLSTPDWRLYAGIHQMLDSGSKTQKRIVKKKRKKTRKLAQIDSYMPQENPFMNVDLPEEEPMETITLKDVNFKFDSDYEILEGGIHALQKVADRAKEIGATKLIIEGHTDYKGSDAYNDNLSQRRADTVRKHLIKYHNFDEDMVISIGYGENRPKTYDTSDRGRQENRRVEVKMYEN